VVALSMWWWTATMILSALASTWRTHQSNVSASAAPAGYPPRGPRPTGGPPSLRSPIIRNSTLSAWKLYRAHVPSTG
jgi:hypothetical protein